MIRPKPKPGQGRQRGVALGVTVALLLGMHAGLKGIPVPAFASSKDVIRELDPLIFERLAAPLPPEDASDPVAEEVSEEVPNEGEGRPTLEQEVGLAMEQLERRFSSDEGASTAGERSPEVGGAPISGIADDVAGGRFESLFGTGDEVLVGRASRGRVRQPRSGQAGVGVGITERLADPAEERTAGSADADGPAVSVETAAARGDVEGAGEVVIREYESDTFGGSDVELLATWMRANRTELPVGVRVHLDFEPSFLTAAVPFSSEGREWELYLMFNESLRELRIVLVEGDRSVYLIDRGFQEQSQSLREGTVRRSNGEIVAVDSRSGAASSARAREFYNIFLSWWEVAKQDVRTP
jgi:hypothetical protein